MLLCRCRHLRYLYFSTFFSTATSIIMQPFKVLLVLSLTTFTVGSEDKSNGKYVTLPPLREQAALKDSWTKSRIESIPALLAKYGIDAWIVGPIMPQTVSLEILVSFLMTRVVESERVRRRHCILVFETLQPVLCATEDPSAFPSQYHSKF
jgi:hypothetical protein